MLSVVAERVSVGTAVEAKAMVSATDAKPVCRAIQMLGRVAKRSSIMPRQSHGHVGKKGTCRGKKSRADPAS